METQKSQKDGEVRARNLYGGKTTSNVIRPPQNQLQTQYEFNHCGTAKVLPLPTRAKKGLAKHLLSHSKNNTNQTVYKKQRAC